MGRVVVRWFRKYGNKYPEKEKAKVRKVDPDPLKGLDYILAGFKPSDELIEQRERVEELNFSTRNYGYGI